MTESIGGTTHLSWHASSPFCSFDIAGATPSSPGSAESLDEAEQDLGLNESGFDGSLTVSTVSGCCGAIAHGDPLALTLDVSHSPWTCRSTRQMARSTTSP